MMLPSLPKSLKKLMMIAIFFRIHGQKNAINFLNIKKGGFSGSEVGPLNLARPEKWQGPYEGHTLEVQDIHYLTGENQKGIFYYPRPRGKAS